MKSFILNNTSRMVMVFFLMVIFLLVVASSPTDTSESTPHDENIITIKTVLKQTFTGPDLELIKLLHSPENTTIIGKERGTSIPESPTDLDVYLEEMYQSYFTKNMYSEYIGVYALSYSFKKDYQMQVDRIHVEQNQTDKNVYSFTAYVQYAREGNEQMLAEFSGRVHFSEGGKIAGFKLFTDDGISKALQAGRNK